MRKLFTLIVLAGMVGLTVPSFSQQRGPAPQAQHAQKAGSPDIEADIQHARQALEQAKSQLEAAGHEWGGHRINAIKHVDGALAELTAAEKWARAHKAIK